MSKRMVVYTTWQDPTSYVILFIGDVKEMDSSIFISSKCSIASRTSISSTLVQVVTQLGAVPWPANHSGFYQCGRSHTKYFWHAFKRPNQGLTAFEARFSLHKRLVALPAL